MQQVRVVTGQENMCVPHMHCLCESVNCLYFASASVTGLCFLTGMETGSVILKANGLPKGPWLFASSFTPAANKDAAA